MKIKKKWLLAFYQNPERPNVARVVTNAHTQFCYTGANEDSDCNFFQRLAYRPFWNSSYVPRDCEIQFVMPSEFFT